MWALRASLMVCLVLLSAGSFGADTYGALDSLGAKREVPVRSSGFNFSTDASCGFTGSGALALGRLAATPTAQAQPFDGTACSDSIDNDADGLVDLADAGCLADLLRDDETGEFVVNSPFDKVDAHMRSTALRRSAVAARAISKAVASSIPAA